MDFSTILTITPGGGLTLNFFLKCKPTKYLAAIIEKITIKITINNVLIFTEVFIFYLRPYSDQDPSYMIGFLSFKILLAIAKMHAVTPDPQVNTC